MKTRVCLKYFVHYCICLSPLFKTCLMWTVECGEYRPRWFPAGIYLVKVNNRNTRTRYEICSKLTIKIPERRHWRRSGIFIVNFKHISHLVLVFLLLTLNMYLPAGLLALTKSIQSEKSGRYFLTIHLFWCEIFWVGSRFHLINVVATIIE